MMECAEGSERMHCPVKWRRQLLHMQLLKEVRMPALGSLCCAMQCLANPATMHLQRSDLAGVNHAKSSESKCDSTADQIRVCRACICLHALLPAVI